jgi:hypothetical protein
MYTDNSYGSVKQIPRKQRMSKFLAKKYKISKKKKCEKWTKGSWNFNRLKLTECNFF